MFFFTTLMLSALVLSAFAAPISTRQEQISNVQCTGGRYVVFLTVILVLGLYLFPLFEQRARFSHRERRAASDLQRHCRLDTKMPGCTQEHHWRVWKRPVLDRTCSSRRDDQYL
jgi:hypothetical protein